MAKKIDLTHYSRRHLVHITYWLGFLVYLHAYLLIYINAPFLSTHFSDEVVGLLFSGASLAGLLTFVVTPHVLRIFGNYKTTIATLLIEILVVAGLAFNPSISLIIIFFVVHTALVRVIGFTSDVFLESGSDDANTGGIRGIFLTVTNTALVFSPIIVGFILGSTVDYWKIYLLSAAVLIPALIFLVTRFRDFKDPEYKHIPFFKTLKDVWHRKDVYKILMSNILLRIFYAVMVIYTPIFMHDHIGFEWETIGIIFTIMLIPYAVFEYPLGRLADTRLGEKEILTVGFVIMALATMLMSFIISTSALVWTLILLATRVGASAVEIMNETYFFKHVGSDDTDTISLFRMVQPLPYIIAPLIGSLVLAFVDFRFIFLVIGVITLFGLRYSLTIKDTR